MAAASTPDSQSRRSQRRNFSNTTLAERVYTYLREDILTNRYPPETPLPEESIAAEFNVSRAPVREALRRLAAEGLVTVVPRQGAVVSSLSRQEFLDAYQVREALEVLAVRLATPQLDASDIEELEALHERMADHVKREEVDDFFRLNAAFHSLFVDKSGNKKLQELYHPLTSQMRRYYLPSLYLRGGMQQTVEEHKKILEAVKSGDVERATQLLSEHIRVLQRSLETDDSIELVTHTPME